MTTPHAPLLGPSCSAEGNALVLQLSQKLKESMAVRRTETNSLRVFVLELQACWAVIHTGFVGHGLGDACPLIESKFKIHILFEIVLTFVFNAAATDKAFPYCRTLLLFIPLINFSNCFVMHLFPHVETFFLGFPFLPGILFVKWHFLLRALRLLLPEELDWVVCETGLFLFLVPLVPMTHGTMESFELELQTNGPTSECLSTSTKIVYSGGQLIPQLEW